MRTALSIAIGSVLALAAPAAFAQEPPANPPTVETTTTVQTPKVTTKTTTTTAGAEDDTTDHEKVVGRFAVGYMGVQNIPIATFSNAGVGAATVQAPVIGGRYWLSKLLGIDAGIGFAFVSSSGTVDSGNTSTTTDGPSIFGVALHGGVPLALASGKHMTFQVVPELNVGFAHSSVKGPPDISLNGFRLDIGARAGAELQFGFIGIPELALQATVGLYISHISRSATQDAVNTNPEVKVSGSQTSFSTSVQNDPWALFVNNVSALYYF